MDVVDRLGSPHRIHNNTALAPLLCWRGADGDKPTTNVSFGFFLEVVPLSGRCGPSHLSERLISVGRGFNISRPTPDQATSANASAARRAFSRAVKLPNSPNFTLQEILPGTSGHEFLRQRKARPAGARADLTGACVRFAGPMKHRSSWPRPSSGRQRKRATTESCR